jgi:Ser/Thr protein kinase RdoA (MazF antagonist)
VYGWGDDHVVKVYRRAFVALAPVERERAALVHAAGVPSPAVHGLVDVEGRTGLVFDRAPGPSLLDQLLRRERSAEEVGRALGELHVAIHALDAGRLPHLADTLIERGVEPMARASAPFHGDFHPGNVLVGGDHPVVVDWSNAHRAPAAADVACSILALGYRGLRHHQPDLERARRSRRRILDAYVEAYRSAAPHVVDGVEPWFTAIGGLLLAQEPDTADADELRARIRSGTPL